MSCLTKLGLEELSFNARCLGSTQDLKIGDLVLPADAEDGTKSTHIEWFQLLAVPAVQRPGVTPIKKRYENNGTVDLELCGEWDVVLVEQSKEPVSYTHLRAHET